MFSIDWGTPLGLFELILGAVTFALLLRSGSLKSYWPLLYIVLWQVLPVMMLSWLRAYKPVSGSVAYKLYFYTYWSAFACAAVFSVLLTYTIFEEALRPLKGLQSLGHIMYRWVLGISAAVMISSAFGAPDTNVLPLVRVVSELMRLSGIVILCLLLFVGFTIRPLGLSLRSRTFGVSVGLAVIMTAYILLTGGIFSSNLNSRYTLLLTSAGIFSQSIWVWYFAVPEPQRRFLLLPTTSPFHQWNLVSERMGYDPGYVAIGGVPPSSFAEAERTIFERIAEQDNGRSPRLNEIPEETSLPLGWTSATENATERFNKVWNMRYGSTAHTEEGKAPNNSK